MDIGELEIAFAFALGVVPFSGGPSVETMRITFRFDPPGTSVADITCRQRAVGVIDFLSCAR